jgi:hypothetical protein
MRLARLRHRATGRIHDVYLHDDGTADRLDGAIGVQVHLDDYVCIAASEPAPARADDGARVEAHSAGAEERHGWSVSATRTIGNVDRPPFTLGQFVRYDGSDRDCVVTSFTRAPTGKWWVTTRDVASGKHFRAGAEWWRAVQLTAADLDAVRDEPVMPDETPLADMAKPDDVFAELAAWAAKEMVAPSPLAPPTLVQLPRDPLPGVCPTCRVQRRERGEVRVHYWRCGCVVRPDFEGPALDQRWAGRGYHEEVVRRVSGFGVKGDHPTRDGAIAAWREALAEAQRREDAQ